MYATQVLPLLVLLAAAPVALSAADPAARLAFGQPVDSLRQFPHHVDITVLESRERCGGSILNKHWILTSAFCVRPGIRLELNFRKRYDKDIGSRYFSVSVNRDQVFLYPTDFDDIGLIKVPISLDFAENLAPINISSLPIEALRGRFTVMPGFDERYEAISMEPYTTTRTTAWQNNCPPNSPMCTTTVGPSTTTTTTTCAPPTTEYWPQTTTGTPPTTAAYSTPCYGCPLPPTAAPSTHHPWDEQERRTDDLRYGMFNILDSKVCKRFYKGSFDEYTQLCIDAWGDNPNTPCSSDFGSGLVVGWPARSELIGLYSAKSGGSCDNRDPAIFTFIDKYMGWIQSLIQG